MDSHRPVHLIHGLVSDPLAPDPPVGAFQAELAATEAGATLTWTWLPNGPTTELELHPTDPLSWLLTT